MSMTSESSKKQLQAFNQTTHNSHPSPSYSFHGSNSSHSTDNGSGARTYHISNYATSYANKKSSLISVTFEEDKNTSKSIMTVVVFFLLFTAVPLSIMASKPLGLAQYIHAHATRATEFVKQPGNIPAEETWKPDSQQPVDEKAESSQNAETRGGGKSLLKRHHRHTSDMTWDEPKANNRCQGFGKREYTARLWNLPFYTNWTKTCENTEVTIHDVVISKPSFCENKWPFGGVIGHWIIDFGEEDCLASWGKIIDKGCVKSNSSLRRFQARLNLKKAEDWAAICSSAPIKIRGTSISKPTVCDNQGFWGVYGVWDVEDSSC